MNYEEDFFEEDYDCEDYEDWEYEESYGCYDDTDYLEETWYALTDGMYGDYPGPGVDYDVFGF